MGKSLNTFDKILSSSSAHIYWLDRNNVYQGCNDAFAIAAGLKSHAEIIGKRNQDLPICLKNPETAIAWDKVNLEVMTTGEQQILEETNTYLDNTEITLLSHKTPLEDQQGTVIGLLGISTNITKQQLQENLLKRNQDTIEKTAHTIIEIMSGCIAHELRTPLSVIGINIDRIQMELKKLLAEHCTHEQSDIINNLINNIKFAVKNGSHIITMLLVKTNNMLLDQSRSSIKLTPQSIKQNIKEACSEYLFYKNERDFIIWNEQLNRDFIYMGDTLLTKHVLFNLIRNAVKAIKEAGHGKIFITLQANKTSNQLIIKDTAAGIPAEKIEKLFQPFGNNNKDGLGLGLAFCKIIMQSYGGTITCDSKKGKYTTFTLSFPIIGKQ